MALTREALLGHLTHDNVVAFLRVIRQGESSQDQAAYTILNGGEHFAVPPWAHPQRVGKGGASTAAGAYQIIKSTWTNLVSKYGFEDFSPRNQDCAAVALIAGRGMLDNVLAGRVNDAVKGLSQEWECFANNQWLIAEAEAVFVKWGGSLAGASDAAPEPVPGAAPAPIEKEVKPMAPFLGALISAAISAAPDLIRLIGGGERSQKNAAVMDKVAEVALQVTGAVNEQQAAERLQDGATAERFRQAVRDNYDQWFAMTVKFREMDEVSIGKAREFATVNRFPIILGMTFIEVLSLIFVAISSLGGGYVLYGDFPPEIKGAVITLMLIGGFTGVKEFWFGSSRGSMVKEGK